MKHVIHNDMCEIKHSKLILAIAGLYLVLVGVFGSAYIIQTIELAEIKDMMESCKENN